MNTKPDASFTAALEWQLRSELRRGEANGARRGWGRGVTLVAVALVSGIAGAACLGAAQQVQEFRRAEVIIAGLAMRQNAVREAMAVARKAAQQTEAMVNIGTATVVESRRAALRAALAEIAAAVTTLDLEEVRATQRAARDEVSAPLVGRRDFVLERLKLRQAAAEQTAKAELESQSMLANRINLGLANAQDAEDAALAVETAIDSQMEVAERMKLRAKFLGREFDAATAEAADLRVRAAHVQKTAELRVAAANKRLTRATVMREAGVGDAAAVTEARLALLNLQVDLEVAKAEAAALNLGP